MRIGDEEEAPAPNHERREKSASGFGHSSDSAALADRSRGQASAKKDGNCDLEGPDRSFAGEAIRVDQEHSGPRGSDRPQEPKTSPCVSSRLRTGIARVRHWADYDRQRSRSPQRCRLSQPARLELALLDPQVAREP